MIRFRPLRTGSEPSSAPTRRYCNSLPSLGAVFGTNVPKRPRTSLPRANIPDNRRPVFGFRSSNRCSRPSIGSSIRSSTTNVPRGRTLLEHPREMRIRYSTKPSKRATRPWANPPDSRGISVRYGCSWVPTRPKAPKPAFRPSSEVRAFSPTNTTTSSTTPNTKTFSNSFSDPYGTWGSFSVW